MPPLCDICKEEVFPSAEQVQIAEVVLHLTCWMEWAGCPDWGDDVSREKEDVT